MTEARKEFERIVKDMGITEVRWDERFNQYTGSDDVAKLWRVFNRALELKDVPADNEEPIEVPIEEIHSASLYFSWGQRKCGFGQLSIGMNKDTREITSMNEGMSRRWVRKALHAAIDTLVDNAKMLE